MQQCITDTVHLGQTLNPADDALKLKAINYGSDFKDVIYKIKKLEILMRKIRMDANLLKYLPGIMNIGYQSMIYKIITRKSLLLQLIKILRP